MIRPILFIFFLTAVQASALAAETPGDAPSLALCRGLLSNDERLADFNSRHEAAIEQALTDLRDVLHSDLGFKMLTMTQEGKKIGLWLLGRPLTEKSDVDMFVDKLRVDSFRIYVIPLLQRLDASLRSHKAMVKFAAREKAQANSSVDETVNLKAASPEIIPPGRGRFPIFTMKSFFEKTEEEQLERSGCPIRARLRRSLPLSII